MRCDSIYTAYDGRPRQCAHDGVHTGYAHMFITKSVYLPVSPLEEYELLYWYV